MHVPGNHFSRDGLVADARYLTILTRRLDADTSLRYAIQNSYGALWRLTAPYGTLEGPTTALWRPMARYAALRHPAAPYGGVLWRPTAPSGRAHGGLRQPMAPCGALPAWWPSPASPALGLPPLPTRLPSLGSNKNELEIYVK